MAQHKSIKPTKRSIVASCMNPTQEEVYRAAVAYARAGISFYPIQCDATQMPAFKLLPRHPQTGSPMWKPYQKRRPTMDEITKWFDADWAIDEFAFSVITGAVSGNMEAIDFDDYSVVQPWIDVVEDKAPGLTSRLVQVLTPRPGLHIYYRCPTIGRNDVLAKIPDPQNSNEIPKAIIELKGEGGSGITPPAPAECHHSGKCYSYIDIKDLTQVETITIAEREILLEAARSFNTWEAPERFVASKPSGTSRGKTGRPGDDFNLRASWSDILAPHGWTLIQTERDGTEKWRRPGKSVYGSSASAYSQGSNLLYVFSTNAFPFEDEESYDKFHAYTLLNHKGDFSAAAQALAMRGYGRPRIPARRRSKKRQRPNRYQ